MTDRTMRPWTTTEVRTLRQLYPALGPHGIAEHLPGRTLLSIQTRASTEGVRFLGQRRHKSRAKWHPTEAIDRALEGIYSSAGPGERQRPRLKDLARDTGYPDWWLKRRACDLGLSRPATRSPPWSEAELAILERHHGHDLDGIRRKLLEAGYVRTRTAIHIARRRRRLGVRPDDQYTATGLAKLLGVDNKTVCSWCALDWIDATRRGSERTAAQGGDMWWISHDAVRAFVRDHAHRIDLRKVRDQQWFIALLAGEPADGRQHRRAKPAAADASQAMAA